MRWKAVLEVLSKDAIPNGILETFVLGTGTTYTTPPPTKFWITLCVPEPFSREK
jgi:hypothetical protein